MKTLKSADTDKYKETSVKRYKETSGKRYKETSGAKYIGIIHLCPFIDILLISRYVTHFPISIKRYVSQNKNVLKVIYNI